MVPVLQPAESQPGPRVFRPLFVGHEASPINIFYAQVTPEQQTYLMVEKFAETEMRQKKLEVICLNNWWENHKDLAWEVFEDKKESVPILTARSESYALSTILLSNGHLKGVHKYFGDEKVFIGIPDRFTVLVHNNSMVLSRLVARIYKEAFRNGTQLSPDVFVSQNGYVVGYEERASMGAQNDGNSEELFLTIQKVFCYAFLMICIADEEPDMDEITKFTEILNAIAGQGHTIVHRACTKMQENDFAVLGDVLHGGAGRAAMLMLDCIRGLKTSLLDAEYDIMKATTLKIGREVALAAGESSGLEAEISKTGRDALDILDSLFTIA